MPLRLVVIEDDQDDVEIIVGALEELGLYIVRAPADLDELLQLLESFNPHCVLCDHRLAEQQWAYSGVRLAIDLGSQRPWILMTKWSLDVREVSGAWSRSTSHDSPIKNFYNKLDPIERLFEVLEETIAAHVPINDSLLIDPLVMIALIRPFTARLINAGRLNALAALHANLSDLLRMLFRKYDQISVERSICEPEGAVLLQIRARRGDGEPDDLLLLCGVAEQLRGLLDAFEARYRPNSLLGMLERRTWLDVAGAVFAFGSSLDQLRTLGELCFSRPPAQIGPLLDRLIVQQGTAWQLNGATSVSGAVALAAIRAQLHLPEAVTPAQAETWLRGFAAAGSAPSLSYDSATRRVQLVERSGRPVAYPNPFDALAKLDQLGAGWFAPCGPLYGPPRPDEILIDELHGQLIFWNYQQFADHAPRLLFMAKLEAQLLFEVLQQGDALDRYELQLALLAEAGSPVQLALSSAMQPVYELLHGYRNCVRRQLGLADMRPHYAALLLCALQMLRPAAGEVGVRGNAIHALLAALVLAEELLGPVKPDDDSNGLYINLQTLEVKIDGEQVEQTRGRITRRDRTFLIFLYERPERIVSYQEIVCDFIGTTTREKLQQMEQWERNNLIDSQKGTIEIIMSRLRKVVRGPTAADGSLPPNEKWRYLKTEKGIGVMLVRRPPADQE